ncbi:hypothetical protein AC249_AIPGENE24109 [Exaiptasia diaphana]|nr:hypothetical protein AC249_AIPGENE24109 [Exaiptasia diaphana]
MEIKLGPMLVVYAYHSKSDYPLPYRTQHDHQGFKTVEILPNDTLLPGNLSSLGVKNSSPHKTATKVFLSPHVPSTSSSLSLTSLFSSTSIVSALQVLSTSSSSSPLPITLTATKFLSSSSTPHFSSLPKFSVRSSSSMFWSSLEIPQPSSSTSHQPLSSSSSTLPLLPLVHPSSLSSLLSPSPSYSRTAKVSRRSTALSTSIVVSFTVTCAILKGSRALSSKRDNR